MKKSFKYLGTVIIVLIIFVALFSYFYLASDNAVGPNLVTCWVGVIVSALVTLVLLKGQTQDEEEKDKNTKVFEEKLKMYQDFLKTLNQVLHDGKVTNEEVLRLKFKIALMALHTGTQGINEISKSVNNIFSKANGRGNLNIDEVELKDLFLIVNQFRQEIYGDQIQMEALEEAIKNFEGIDISYNEPNDTSNPDSKTDNNSRDDLIKELSKSGWTYSDDEAHPLMFEKQKIIMKVESDSNGWYFSIVLNSPTYKTTDQRELYKALRRTFGGAFNTNRDWGWYVYILEKYKTLTPTEFADAMTNDAELRQYLYSRINKFAAIMDKFATLMNEIMPKIEMRSDKWNTWLYLEELSDGKLCIANDFGDDDGHPVVDIAFKDGYYTAMALRNDSKESLHDYMERIGLGSEAICINKDNVYLEKGAIDDVIAEANKLIAHIEQADK